MHIITSNQNKIIKHAKSLQLKKNRDSYGEYLIEGIKLLKEAIAYDVPISAALYHNKSCDSDGVQEIIKQCEVKGIPIYGLEDKPYLDISETKNPQGVVGIGKKSSYDIDALIHQKSFNAVLLEEVQDPGNVGTIIRTADAFGFDFVLLSKGCADIYSGKTIRSTMGSLFHIPIVPDMDIESLLTEFDDMGVLTIAAAPHAGKPCYDIQIDHKNLIVIGNESKGLSDAVMNKVRIKANIPMPGSAESLNAGVAASVIMYEIMRYKLTK